MDRLGNTTRVARTSHVGEVHSLPILSAPWALWLFRSTDRDRAPDTGDIALSVPDENRHGAALQVLDRRGQRQLAHALRLLLEPRRQVFARLDTVDGEVGCHSKAGQVQA